VFSLKTFQATDHHSKIKYDFKFSDGKLVKLTVSKSTAKVAAVEAYANPTRGQNPISKQLFDKAFRVVCTDPLFNDYKGFLEQLNKDETFRKDAEKIIAGYIGSMAVKIRRMSLALEEA
jgi:hypothetical protein